MLNLEVEKKLATYLAIGTFFITIFLLAGTNSDPVNVTKLFALGGLGVATLAVAMNFGSRILLVEFKTFLLTVLAFNAFLIVSSVLSRAPFSQNYFGAYGRNNGLLTYSLLSAVMISALLLSREDSYRKGLYALFASGITNILYCGWVITFGDFIGWNNPYGNILGLFGNPDFISAFLGMFIAGSLAYIASNRIKTSIRIFLSVSSIAALFEIVKSHAIQGLVVTFSGAAIVCFYVIRSFFKKSIITLSYMGFVLVLGLLGVLGTLQKGPLSFVYKRSISMRGTYWRAGLDMGNSHPLTGVGMDTYGDWYRRTRPAVALIDTPGIKTMSNVSHNVVIDFFASGGFPLLLSYIAILAFGIVSIVRVTLRQKKYDEVFVGLSAVWLCYELQSIISINQIGLAVWGWLFTGLLVAYERTTRNLAESSGLKPNRKRDKQTSRATILTPQLVGGIGFLIGILIALPPYSADSKWFKALGSHDAAKVEAALAQSFFNPADSYRYARAVNLFQNSNLNELAHKYAILAVKFNPDYFDAWKQLYLLPNASNTEKAQALSNMKRLDPKNPDVVAN